MKKAMFFAALAAVLTGCNLSSDNTTSTNLYSEEDRAALKEYLNNLVTNQGQQAAIAYVDKLVAEGRLGAKNAEEIKNDIPNGIEKIKNIMEGETK